MNIPQEVLDTIRKRAKNALAEIVEESAYDYVDTHSDTLWTGLELISAINRFQENGGQLT